MRSDCMTVVAMPAKKTPAKKPAAKKPKAAPKKRSGGDANVMPVPAPIPFGASPAQAIRSLYGQVQAKRRDQTKAQVQQPYKPLTNVQQYTQPNFSGI
jgi:hypothetical protein